MISLKGITWENPRGYDPLVESAKQYESKNQDIKIEWEQYSWYEFERRILDDFIHGKGLYDLIMFDHPWTGTLCENKWLLPWDDFLSKNYFEQLKQRVVEPSLESYYYNEKHWALPLDAASHCALYQGSNDLGANLPKHWENIKHWCLGAQKWGYPTPIVLSLQGVLGSCLFLSMMAAYGKPAFSNPKEANIDKLAAEYILSLLKNLQSFCPLGSSHWAPWDIYDKFCQDDKLLYSPSIFAYVNYLGENKGGNNLHLSKVPSFEHNNISRAIIGGVGLGISYSCEHVEEAIKYGVFLMSDEIQKEVFSACHGQPAVKAVWEDVSMNEKVNNFYLDLKPNMDMGYIRPRFNGFHSVELAIGQILQKWWDDEVNLHQTLDALNEIMLEYV